MTMNLLDRSDTSWNRAQTARVSVSRSTLAQGQEH